jgi:hypothetical protein
MIFPKQIELNGGKVLAKELNENSNKSTKFWLKVWQDCMGFTRFGERI